MGVFLCRSKTNGAKPCLRPFPASRTGGRLRTPVSVLVERQRCYRLHSPFTSCSRKGPRPPATMVALNAGTSTGDHGQVSSLPASHSCCRSLIDPLAVSEQHMTTKSCSTLYPLTCRDILQTYVHPGRPSPQEGIRPNTILGSI